MYEKMRQQIMPLELLKSKTEDLTGFIVAITRQTSANGAELD